MKTHWWHFGLTHDSPTEECHIDAAQNKSHPLLPKLQLLAIPLSEKQLGDRHLPEVIDITWLNNISIWRGPQKVEKLLQPKGLWSFCYRCETVLDLLHGIYKRGCRYSGICAPRSALPSFVTITGCERM